MMTELWKDVVGYEDILMVSSLGNVWSKRSKKNTEALLEP
jgi:hypothetical protein